MRKISQWAGWAAVVITVLYAMLSANSTIAAQNVGIADNTQRIQALETSTVTRREIDQLDQRLGRIETEVMQLDSDVRGRR